MPKFDPKLAALMDPKTYIEAFTKIKSKGGGMIPFILNEAQKDIFNTMQKHSRVMILKARQIGFSTAITAYLYHKTITTPGINTALIGYNSDLTAELLDKVKTFWSTTPEELRPTIQYNSKYEISFPKMNSKIIVLPSSENVGRGYTLHNVLLTEMAFWDRSEEKMAAIENAVPLTGKIIVETTPNGIGNMFHRMWMAKDSGYEKKEYGWWWMYSEDEIEQIRKRMNNPRLFAQEYSLEFLSTGRQVFDIDIIREMKARHERNIGEALSDQQGIPHFVKEWEGLRVYREAESGATYVAGVDVAEGVDGGDYSVCSIWNRANGEEVAFWRGHMSPDQFAAKLNLWGRHYNNALMTIEVNNHGLTTLTVMKQLMYPQLYFRPAKFDVMGTRWSDRLGWKTTKITRPLMIDDLVQAIREGTITPHSPEFYDETLTFVYDSGNNMISQSGYHDDAIFAAAIGYQGFKVMYSGSLDQVDYTKYLPRSSSY